MSTERWMRASDRDRDMAAQTLSEAYAVGRLSSAEFHERCAAAHSARTWGELLDLTAHLPASQPSGLPADTDTRRRRPSRPGRRACGHLVWTCLLVLAAGLVGRVFPAAVWAIALVSMIPIVLFTARESGRPRAGRSGHP